MAQKHNKPEGTRRSSVQTKRRASERRRIILIACGLAALLGIVIAIRAKTTVGMVLALIVSILAIAEAMLLIVSAPRRKTSGSSQTRGTASPDRRLRQEEPRQPERVPAGSSRRTERRRPVIDIPLDDEGRGGDRDIEPPVKSGEAVDAGARPAAAADIGTEEAVAAAAAPEQENTVDSPVVIPAYKITPPKHNPELFKRQNDCVVVWPDGKVVPASEYDLAEQTAEEPADDVSADAEAAPAEPEEAAVAPPVSLEEQEWETQEPEEQEPEAQETEELEPKKQEPEQQAPEAENVIYLPESLESWKEAAAEEAPKEQAPSEREAPVAAPVADWQYPTYELLEQPPDDSAEKADAELSANAARLADTLKSFGVEAAAGEAVRGPAVTRYEFTLEPGVKLSKITNLQDDIALALGAGGVRVAPIPDKMSVVGVEVPNRVVSPVSIRSLLESQEFLEHPSSMAFAVGKDISGARIIGDIAKFPHVLIAGTTGSGKSVCTNSLIVSILYKSTPEEVRFIMVDPKMVELAPYNGIPHLLIPVVTDPGKAAGALQWAVYEMMKRYKLFSERGVKDLTAYNELAEADASVAKLPSVVVVIDELADLMLIAAKEVEESICRVAQMGRAAGMHLVIATQSPRADVITGLMKANIPSRIAFAVASSLESRIILDSVGAEKLVGKGDMLYAPLGEGKPRRVQGCFISAAEIERVVDFLKANGEARYDTEVIEKIDQTVAEKEVREKTAADADAEADEYDPMLFDAVDVILETEQASVSMLQRRLKLGYSRAARLVDQMEELGIVGPFEGSKPRKILATHEAWSERKALLNRQTDMLSS